MRKREIPEEGVTRRAILKGGVAAGAAGFLGATAFGTIKSLVSPPQKAAGTVNNGFIYAKAENPKLPIWYENLVGKEARIEDFSPGRGAGVRWKAIVDEEGRVSFPGFPAILIEMEEDVLEFPAEYSRADFVIGGLYALFNCCPHACCPPGWQLVPRSQYTVDPGFETVYCECHFSQYDPRKIVSYTHPPPPEASGVEYPGIYKIPGLGPADRGMPLIPLELEGSKIIGRARDPDWYRYLTWRDTVIPD